MPSHLIASAELTSILTLSLGLIVLLRDVRCRLNQIFALYSLSISIWSFCFSRLHEVSSHLAISLGRILHLGCTFIPVLFAHFTIALAGRYRRHKWRLLVAYLIAGAYNLFNLYPGIFTSQIVYRSGYAYPKPVGLLYFSYFLFFVGLVTWGLIVIWQTCFYLEREAARWLRLFTLLTLVGYAGAMNNFLIMIDVRLYPLFPYGLYMVVLYATISIYTLSRKLPPLRRISRQATKHRSLMLRGRLPPA